MERTVYLDYNAATPLHPRAREAMDHVSDVFANSASIHAAGRAAAKLAESAREHVASLLGADAGEIVFTSGGSESNAAVFHSFLLRGLNPSSARRRGRIIVSSMEHPSVLEAARGLASLDFEIRFLRVDAQGKLDLDDLSDALKSPASLVSVMAANNEIGTVQDLEEIVRLAHERGAFVHSDMVQAAGKLPLDLKGLGVDFASFSAHKLYGPKGVGALYVRNGVPFVSLITGGEQEDGRRAGTTNTAGVCGFAAALESAVGEMAETENRLRLLSKRMRREISARIPGARFNGHPTDFLAGTLSVSFADLEGESLVLDLDQEGIAVSTGSACESGTGEPSHVLLAIGLSAELARGTIRISVGRETSPEDIEYLLEKLPVAVERTRGL